MVWDVCSLLIELCKLGNKVCILTDSVQHVYTGSQADCLCIGLACTFLLFVMIILQPDLCVIVASPLGPNIRVTSGLLPLTVYSNT